MLVREGLLTPAQHLTAVEEAEDTETPFVSVVLRLGFVSEDRLVEISRDRLMVPEAPRDAIVAVPASLIELVPAQMARQFLVCPIGSEDAGSLTLLMADASDRHATDEVSYHTGRRVARMVAAESVVRWAIGHYYHVDLDQPQPPWEQQSTDTVVLLTKIKPVVRDEPDEDEVLLLTPKMRRGVTHAAGPLPPLEKPAGGLKPPPTAPPTAASAPEISNEGLVAMPPLPPAPPPSRAHAATEPGTQGATEAKTPPDAGEIPEPMAVPQLPENPPMESTPTGSGSQTVPYQKEPRKRKKTILGLPKVDAPRIRDAGAYAVSGTAKSAPAVPTKLNVPRAKPDLAQRPEPEIRTHAGLWSSAAPVAAVGERSEAYSSATLALKRARGRDDVGRILFRYFQEFFLNVAFFVIRKGEIAGWDADGIKLTKEMITKISIPTDQQSTFRDAIVARLPRRGQLDETPMDLKFQASIGYRPRDVSLVPVMIRDKVIGIIYSDGIHAPIPEDEVNGLLTEAEAAYERLILDSRGE
jgi:hypothetical protein